MTAPSETQPEPIDIHVGRRIAARRRELGLSQSDLARALSITFQQVQKYERGINRVSASKLWAAAEFLRIPVHALFPGETEATTEVEGEVEVSATAKAIAREVRALSARDQSLVSELIHRLLSEERSRRARKTERQGHES